MCCCTWHPSPAFSGDGSSFAGETSGDLIATLPLVRPALGLRMEELLTLLVGPVFVEAAAGFLAASLLRLGNLVFDPLLLLPGVRLRLPPSPLGDVARERLDACANVCMICSPSPSSLRAPSSLSLIHI